MTGGGRGQGCCRVVVVWGVGTRGTSRMTLSGGKPLGPEGAGRLAGLLRDAPPPLLASMDIRCPISARTHAHTHTHTHT